MQKMKSGEGSLRRKAWLAVGFSFFFAIQMSNPVYSVYSEEGSPDYLIRIVSSGVNTGQKKAEHPPLLPVKPFGPGVVEGRLDYAGVRPLLNIIIRNDSIFRSAYVSLLKEFFKNNRRLSKISKTDFFVPTGNPGSERFAAAIQAGGGDISPRILIDDLGYSWKTMYVSALHHARLALLDGGIKGGKKEMARLEHVIANGMLASIANRFLPSTYSLQWREENEKLLSPIIDRLNSDSSGDNFDKQIRASLIDQLPWLFHVTGMPRPPWASNRLSRYYDSFHFFSYSWLAIYTLYRSAYWGEKRGFVYEEPSTESYVETMKNAFLVSVGFEISSTIFYQHGFLELMDIRDVKGMLGRTARILGIEKVPVIEAIDDLSMDWKGIRFGCAAYVKPFTANDPAATHITDSLLSDR